MRSAARLRSGSRALTTAHAAPSAKSEFATMLSGYDAGLYIIDPPRNDRCNPSSYEPALAAIEDAQAITGRKAFPVASMPENFDEARAIAMLERGVVTLMGLETALAALRAAQIAPADPAWRPLPATAPRETRLLSEADAKALLAQHGIAVPRGVSAPTLENLREKAAGLTPPLALKGLGFAHKTEAGAVRLGLSGLDGEAPMPGAIGYLAEEMVSGAVAELLVGVRRDPVYGATLTIGMGGVTAEILADTVTLVLPADEADILAAMRRLRLWPLLDGYRGRPKADTATAAALAARLGRLMASNAAFEEIEINPVMLRTEGTVAVDALIRMAV